MIAELLAQKCAVSCKNEDGNTPLHMECKTKQDRSEIVKLLIEKRCDPNSKNKKRRTLLHIAAHNGNVKLTSSLLNAKRCILNLPDKHGNIPFHCACSSGSLDTVEMLVSHGGFDINIPNKEGSTPLHIVCVSF